MIEGIITIVVGVVCIVIGALNGKGNISMLHSYHIDNIKEEDKLPFGKELGVAMFIVGGSLLINGVFAIIAEVLTDETYLGIGMGIMGVGLVIGCALALKTIKKYNKKIM